MNVIDPNAVYTDEKVAELLECSTWTIRRHRHAGLRFRKPRGKVYILGSDLLDFLKQDDPIKEKPVNSKANAKVDQALTELRTLRR